MISKRIAQSSALALAGCCLSAACGETTQSESLERAGSSAEALTSSANLLLKEETASCAPNQVQDFFAVTNNGASSVKVSDITIKAWVDDTTAQNIVGQINYGGCLTGANGCFHPVTGVTVTATHFTPACGPDATHQADWEVKISSTDPTTLAPGVTWANIQSAFHLANFANFSPGTVDWYSPCVNGTSFVADGHFAIFVQGNLVSASPGVPPSCRQIRGTTTIPGEVPPGLGTTYPLVGPLPGATQVSLAIGLPLSQTSNTSGLPPLQTFLQQVSDPTNANYRSYLTPSAFAAAYGPPASDYTALQNFATANGLTISQTYTSRDLLVVTGPASAIENAFFVTLNIYRRPDATTFFAPANDPSVSNLTLTSPILHVSGFDTFAVPHPASTTANGTSTHLCRNNPGFFGADIRNIYAPCAAGQLGVSAANEGAGQTVALLELDAYTPSDISSYTSGTSLGSALTLRSGTGVTSLLGSNILQQVVPTSGPTPAPVGFGVATFTPGTGRSEVAVGMEMVLAMAPAAKMVVYEQNTLGSAGFQPDPIFNTIADQDTAQVVANSWTWNGGTPDANIAQALIQFEAQGQSFVQASGDLGSYIAGSQGATTPPEPISDSAVMTVVGGTMFGPVVAGTRTETTWNDSSERTLGGCSPGPGQQVGGQVLAQGSCNSVSGGGFTALTIPSYQVGLTNSDIAAGPSPTPRMIPDVSLLADDLATFTAGAAGCSHGTSASAALWAGYIALSNTNTPFRGPAGFANPSLYHLAAGSASPFNDIQDGSNNNFSGAGAYTSTAGYDLTTGLGSPAQSVSACTTITGGLPPQSCMPGTSLSVLFQKPGTSGLQNVVAYMPVGSYGELVTGVLVTPVEGTATGSQLVQPAGTDGTVPDNVINTCGGDTVTGQVVCTSNGRSVYVINTGANGLPTGTATPIVDGAGQLSTAANPTTFFGEAFSGGNCATCNVAIDPLRGIAYLSIGQPTATGGVEAFFQPLTLASLALGTPVDTTQQATSEDIAVDAVRGFVLSPNEGAFEGSSFAGDYQIFDTNQNKVFNFTPTNTPPTSGGGFDSAAEDCLTGVALSTDEFTNQVFLVDISQATFNTSTLTWTAPNNPFPIPEFTQFINTGAGTSGISVIASGSHVGVIAGEFGSSGFVGFSLPQKRAAAGTVPTLTDYIQANIPNTPDNTVWAMGDDPHTLTAYTSPNTNRQYAVFEDDVFTSALQNGTRTWLAVVDLTALLSTTTTPRGTGPFTGGAPDANQPANALTCCHAPEPSTSANPDGTRTLPQCTVRFVCAIPGGCPAPVAGGC
jgi:Pro-kumamolisin, activation domain